MKADSKGDAYLFTVLVSQTYRKLKEALFPETSPFSKDIEGALDKELQQQARRCRELRRIPACLWWTN